MTNIVKRLRAVGGESWNNPSRIRNEAADEIERLQSVLETRENEIWSRKNELRDITIALDDERINNTITAAEVAREMRAELDALKEQEPVVTKRTNGIVLHAGWDDLPDGTELYAAPVPSVPNIEPLYKLLEYADESDSAQYGTLSTSLVRNLVNEAIAASPKPGEGND